MHWLYESGHELARVIFVLKWSHFVTSSGYDKAAKATTGPTPFTNMYSCVVLKILSFINMNQGANLSCGNLEMYRRLFCACLKSLSFPQHSMLRRGLFSLFSSWGMYSTLSDVSNNSSGMHLHVVTAHRRRLLSRLWCQPWGVTRHGNLMVTSEWFHRTWAEGIGAFKAAWQLGVHLKRTVVSATVLWWLSLVMAKSFRASHHPQPWSLVPFLWS